MENDLRRAGESDWEAFERGVDAALASAPKPRAKNVDQPFITLLAELRRLVDEPAYHSFGAERLCSLVQRLSKCLVLKPQYTTAALTGKAVMVFEPTDAFLRFATALRARDWQQVSLIEHEIISS